MKNIAMRQAFEYLCGYKKADVAVQQLELELYNLRAQAEYHGGSDGEKVQTSAAGDMLAVYVVRILELEQRYATEKEKLLAQRAEIVRDIQALPNATHSDLLYRRYVEHKSMRQIAREMQYSPEYIRNHLHPAALRAMGNYLHREKMLHNVAF